ncbi:MAG: multiheme c-type cytochrome [Phycisphaerales bacterium]
MNETTKTRGFTGAGLIGGLAIVGLFGAVGTAAIVGAAREDTVLYASGDKPGEIAGPDKCAECHPKEAEAWKATHHHATFIDLPRNDKAREIADKLGIRRIKADSTCLSCHFTVQGAAELEPISGISCESCHGAGENWIDIHSTYAAGADRDTETEAQRLQRIEAAVDNGMLSPMDLYAVAENCYQCHTAPNEELVNKGGHPAGSNFDLVAWSQGEVRHNFNRTDNTNNAKADQNTLRVMFVLGKMLDLEYGLRGLAGATENALFAKAMAQRSDRALKQLAQINEVVAIPQIATMIGAVDRSDLKLNNADTLNAAADAVKAAARDFANSNDGSGLGDLDKFVPGEDKWKGSAYEG